MHVGKTFQDLVRDAKERIQEVPADELRGWIAEGKPVVLLDVREKEDYETGHLDGAVHLSRGLLELEIDAVVPDQAALIVVYCGGGSRSALAVDTLKTMGYSNTYSLVGGYRKWTQDPV